MPLQHTQDEGVLTISGISMNPSNGAWMIQGDKDGQGGLIPLWTDYDVRGEDRILPSVTGVIAYQRRMTATRHDLRFVVVGDTIGQTGAAALDQRIGLQTNLEYLRANVFAPVATMAGTRAATLTMPTGSPRAADIHVLRTTTQSYHFEECGSIWIGTLHIDIPEGRFS